jgi:LDH2 family malate/lactate/ureidoglycolate dehydrogenase
LRTPRTAEVVGRPDVACVSHRHRYRLDDLRTFGVDVATGLGLAPARASEFLTSLLWFDAAGASSFGIASLPEWFDAIDGRSIDPAVGGKIHKERTATAVLDAQQGLTPLLLKRAGELAVERAREVGVGMVRVENLGRSCPAGWVAAEIAVGPMVGVVQGPGSSLAVAAPVAGTVAAVFDSALTGGPTKAPGWSALALPAWSAPFSGSGGWLVAALAVTAFEPLATFHERIDEYLGGSPSVPGEVRPSEWEARRIELLEGGLPLPDPVRRELQRWAERFNLAWPTPLAKE